MSKDQDLFDQLRQLILEDDRKENADSNALLLQKIDQLEKDINDPEKFAQLIQQSKDEVIDVLGPTMGKLIKRFIGSEMEKLNNNIKKKRKQIFSFDFLKPEHKKSSFIERKNFVREQLVQLFIIQKDSGLWIGEYSSEEVLDSDLVSGMLTAVKSFVESAFGEENNQNELESLEYSQFSINLFELGTIYFACVFKEKVEGDIKSNLLDDFLKWSEDFNEEIRGKVIDESTKSEVSSRISEWINTKYLQ